MIKLDEEKKQLVSSGSDKRRKNWVRTIIFDVILIIIVLTIVLLIW